MSLNHDFFLTRHPYVIFTNTTKYPYSFSTESLAAVEAIIYTFFLSYTFRDLMRKVIGKSSEKSDWRETDKNRNIRVFRPRSCPFRKPPGSPVTISVTTFNKGFILTPVWCANLTPPKRCYFNTHHFYSTNSVNLTLRNTYF